MRRMRWVLVVGFCLSQMQVAWAQEGNRRRGFRGDRSGGRLGRNLPAVGKKLPALNLFDAEGNEFHLRQLKGNYTVLVFGCLT